MLVTASLCRSKVRRKTNSLSSTSTGILKVIVFPNVNRAISNLHGCTRCLFRFFRWCRGCSSEDQRKQKSAQGKHDVYDKRQPLGDLIAVNQRSERIIQCLYYEKHISCFWYFPHTMILPDPQWNMWLDNHIPSNVPKLGRVQTAFISTKVEMTGFWGIEDFQCTLSQVEVQRELPVEAHLTRAPNEKITKCHSRFLESPKYSLSSSIHL